MTRVPLKYIKCFILEGHKIVLNQRYLKPVSQKETELLILVCLLKACFSSCIDWLESTDSPSGKGHISMYHDLFVENHRLTNA